MWFAHISCTLFIETRRRPDLVLEHDGFLPVFLPLLEPLDESTDGADATGVGPALGGGGCCERNEGAVAGAGGEPCCCMRKAGMFAGGEGAAGDMGEALSCVARICWARPSGLGVGCAGGAGEGEAAPADGGAA